MSIYKSPENNDEGTPLCEQEQQFFKKEQTVEISISQYTDWMLKAHTITQIQKLYDRIDDYECLAEAVGALIKNKGDA